MSKLLSCTSHTTYYCIPVAYALLTYHLHALAYRDRIACTLLEHCSHTACYCTPVATTVAHVHVTYPCNAHVHIAHNNHIYDVHMHMGCRLPTYCRHTARISLTVARLQLPPIITHMSPPGTGGILLVSRAHVSRARDRLHTTFKQLTWY